MKQFFKMLFACLCAFALFGALTFLIMTVVVAGVASSGNKTEEVEENSVLYLDLNEAIEEQGKENTLLAIGANKDGAIGLNDILNSIKAAKKDDKIKGIFIKTGVCGTGWATLKENSQTKLSISTYTALLGKRRLFKSPTILTQNLPHSCWTYHFVVFLYIKITRSLSAPWTLIPP